MVDDEVILLDEDSGDEAPHQTPRRSRSPQHRSRLSRPDSDEDSGDEGQHKPPRKDGSGKPGRGRPKKTPGSSAKGASRLKLRPAKEISCPVCSREFQDAAQVELHIGWCIEQRGNKEAGARSQPRASPAAAAGSFRGVSQAGSPAGGAALQPRSSPGSAGSKKPSGAQGGGDGASSKKPSSAQGGGAAKKPRTLDKGEKQPASNTLRHMLEHMPQSAKATGRLALRGGKENEVKLKP
ncbi:hypothetical protein T484DRAFT_1877221 [Baffinella frigidus]|nr:hypothetical protein T484DRAFT_1877221 [Cryptophyta sp. CCMP2293]